MSLDYIITVLNTQINVEKWKISYVADMKKRRLNLTVLQFMSIIDDSVAYVLERIDPKASVEELIKKSESDDDLCLALADLRFITMSKKLKKFTYQYAARNRKPEALIMLANENYLKILSFLKLDKSGRPAITRGPVCNSADVETVLNLLAEMWDLLEETIDKNWISHFLREQAEDAKETGSYPLSRKIRDTIDRVNRKDSSETLIIQQLYSSGFKCGNTKCQIRTKRQSAQIICPRCGSIRYCSQTCIVFDWYKQHKYFCNKFNYESSGINFQPLNILNRNLQNNKDNEDHYKILKIDDTFQLTSGCSDILMRIKKFKFADADFIFPSHHDFHNNYFEEEKKFDDLIDRAYQMIDNRKYSQAILLLTPRIEDLLFKHSFSEITLTDRVYLAIIIELRMACHYELGISRSKKIHLEECGYDFIVLNELGLFDFTLLNSPVSVGFFYTGRRQETSKNMIDILNGRINVPASRVLVPLEIKKKIIIPCRKFLRNIDVSTSSMVFKTQAINKVCPFCYDEYSLNVFDPVLVLVLVCKHACCAKCFYKLLEHSKCAEEENFTELKCPICRIVNIIYF